MSLKKKKNARKGRNNPRHSFSIYKKETY